MSITETACYLGYGKATIYFSFLSDVLDNNFGRAANRSRSQNFVVLLDIKDISTVGSDWTSMGHTSWGLGECHGAEVVQGDQAVTRLEIFDNPFSFLAA